MKFSIQTLEVKKIHENDGQLDGVPANPRVIDENELEKLKRSITDNPEMLALREVVVVPHDGDFVVICGNMRMRALRELGEKTVVAKVLEDATPKQLRAYTIKDNLSFGRDDFERLEKWDEEELLDFGLAVHHFDDYIPEDETTEIEPPEKDKCRMTFVFGVDENAFVREKLQKIDKKIEVALLKLLGFGESEEPETEE